MCVGFMGDSTIYIYEALHASKQATFSAQVTNKGENSGMCHAL